MVLAITLYLEFGSMKYQLHFHATKPPNSKKKRKEEKKIVNALVGVGGDSTC